MATAKKKIRKSDYRQTSKGRTKQSDRGPSINELVNRFAHSGQPIPQVPWQTMDLSNFDYAQQRDAVAEFNSHFAELPSNIRDTFDNNPSNYLDFLQENETTVTEQGLQAAIDSVLDAQENTDETSENAQNAPEPSSETSDATDVTS